MAERIAASRFATKTGAGYAPGRGDTAGVASRGFAYLIDSVFLLIVAMVFFTIAGAVLLLRSDGGQQNPSDSAIWTFLFVFMLTVPAWLLLNLVLFLRRGQSIGQSIAGLAPLREDGGRLGVGRMVVYWLALHPLLFHPIIGVFWLLVSYLAVVETANDVLLYGSMALAGLSLLAPFAGFLFAIGDPRHRGIHDRIAGVKVVRLE